MAGPPSGPQDQLLPVRASDADREAAVAKLRERFAAGQLSQETFVFRMEAALGARDRGDLAALLADLPDPRRPAWRPGWRGVPGRISRGAAAAFTPVREAMTSSARRASSPWRRSLPGLRFPAGSQLSFTIGRDPDCDLVIADITVSRQHAHLDRGQLGWTLADFGSTNGTRLNGWRVREPVPVRSGDEVSFGAITFVLLADG